jgi:hypothetical protein
MDRMELLHKPTFLFLGAGASVEAGLPSAAAITRHFETFSLHTSRPQAVLIENLFRVIQGEIASKTHIPASTVDFETVLGILLEAAEGRNILGTQRIAEFIHDHFQEVDLRRLCEDLTLYIRGMCLPIREVAYLDILLHAVWNSNGTIATLNYDVSVERRHHELKRPLTTGFGGERGDT